MLARGLQASVPMRRSFWLLAILVAWPLSSSIVEAQEGQLDAIVTINGETPLSSDADVYFNAANCASPGSTTYEVRLANGAGVTEAYMWAGAQNGKCELNASRTDLQLLCRPMADSQPRVVGANATITSLTLQELVDTGIVNCENTALTGTPYQIYSFRNQDPGGTDVSAEGYGAAPFFVDVTPPSQLTITSELEQDGSSFTISWEQPVDFTKVEEYKLYRGSSPDPAAAADTGIVNGQGLETSISVTASQLGLSIGDEAYLFVSAVDMASVVPGNGNEGELSEATRVISSQTLGFCDDPGVDCSGCSVSAMMLPNGQPGAGLWLVGLVLTVLCGWRLRR
jgi:hypothetical protein